jgi:GT2 family glycosyltransferase
MSGPPRLVVVVATYNRLALLRRCLDSIAATTRVTHEVVVVDGGSTDGTRDELPGRPGVRLVLQDALLGLPHAYNTVWRELDCDYTCWLSDDTELVDSALDTAVGVLDLEPRVGMVGLKMRDLVEGAEEYAGGVSSYGILNCNHGVLRLDLLREVGYFHEGYDAYGVDPDLTASVLSAGATVVMTKRIALDHHRQRPVRAAERLSVKRDAAENPARRLYRERFRYLSAPEPAARRGLRGAARLALRLASLGDPPTRFGLDRRDRFVLANARFLSPLDPLRARGRPVHLVQRVPTRLLLDEANPYRALAEARRRPS